MKKILCLALAIVLALSFAACGGSSQDSGSSDGASDFEWTRTGLFSDEDDNVAYIMKSDQEDYPGWSVTFMVDEESHGWFIQQEGETLHGDLTSEYEEGRDPFVVTVSEEGEDGILIEVEGGDTYHMTPQETPEVFATLTINVDGVGEVAYAEGEGEPEFDDEYSITSHYINMAEPGTYTLGARTSEENYEFVKWTLNGEDYSEEPQITVEITEDSDFVAVFEFKG